jgi:hypothetical protein
MRPDLARIALKIEVAVVEVAVGVINDGDHEPIIVAVTNPVATETIALDVFNEVSVDRGGVKHSQMPNGHI